MTTMRQYMPPSEPDRLSKRAHHYQAGYEPFEVERSSVENVRSTCWTPPTMRRANVVSTADSVTASVSVLSEAKRSGATETDALLTTNPIFHKALELGD